MTTTETTTVREKFHATIADAVRSLIERDGEVLAVLLALIAGEHVLLVGPPGTAKSALCNLLTSWQNGVAFKILLTKFTDPSETCGPLDLPALKAGRYERLTAGMLPDCDIAFADEVFKASSAILNTLLTMMEERTFKNGRNLINCPLQMLIGASNEFPGDHDGGGEELGALFDRFLVRRIVSPIATAQGLTVCCSAISAGGYRPQRPPKKSGRRGSLLPHCRFTTTPKKRSSRSSENCARRVFSLVTAGFGNR